MSLVGLGLLAVAAVEAAALVFPSVTPAPASTLRPIPLEALGLLSPMSIAESDAAADPQSAVGTGPAAPKARDKGTAPAPSGSVIGIAATPIPNGTALFRLWSSGAVEAMISTEADVWSDWTSVAPGQTTDKRRPRAPSDNPDTNP
ncbi:MAG: hypothetical protein FGM39_05900 [Phycisphaerales bacterium]|nr:hypothetical protein [Phycisphaerales bacterium]